MRRDIETLWSVEDVADYLAMPVQSIYEMTAQRCIPHLKIGEHLRFRRADIDRWLDSLAVPCLDLAPRPVSHRADNPGALRQHRDSPMEAPPTSTEPAPQKPITSSQSSPPPPSKPTNKLPVLAAPSRRDGPEYLYLQEIVKRMGESYGFRVIEPQGLDGQGTVDVALDRGGWRLACQISVMTSSTEQEIGNVRKCLDSGFDAVAVVSPNKRQAGKLRHALAKGLPQNEADRVKVLGPEELLDYFEKLATPVDHEKTVAGYKVTVRYVQTDPADQERRRQEVARILARGLLRMKKLGS